MSVTGEAASLLLWISPFLLINHDVLFAGLPFATPQTLLLIYLPSNPFSIYFPVSHLQFDNVAVTFCLRLFVYPLLKKKKKGGSRGACPCFCLFLRQFPCGNCPCGACLQIMNSMIPLFSFSSSWDYFRCLLSYTTVRLPLLQTIPLGSREVLFKSLPLYFSSRIWTFQKLLWFFRQVGVSLLFILSNIVFYKWKFFLSASSHLICIMMFQCRHCSFVLKPSWHLSSHHPCVREQSVI